MRHIERIVVVGGVVLAYVFALNGQESQPPAGGERPAPAAAQGVRIATVDTFAVVEKILDKPNLKKAREDLASQWAARADVAERELDQLQERLQNMQPTDPQARQVFERAQQKQAEYQQLAQQRQDELERMNASQLIDAFKQIRGAAQAVSSRLGYTHVLSSRSESRSLTVDDVPTLGGVLQELLARPVVVGVPADDITAEVMKELSLNQ